VTVERLANPFTPHYLREYDYKRWVEAEVQDLPNTVDETSTL